jgi:aspartyl protease family protein
MGQIIAFALVLLVAGVLGARFLERGPPAPIAMAAAPEAAAVANNSRSVTLKRADNGHFQAEARVDGRRIEFIIDTGASHIALRESDAARLGIRPTPRDYTVKVATANGEGRAARAELRSVEIGGIVVRDLVAFVHPDEALSVNLLGMSFLSRVRWTYERGRLVLEQ